MNNVIFDFGNVMIDWRPFRSLSHIFDSECQMERVFAQIGFYDWNLEQDRGESRELGLKRMERAQPRHYHVFQSYVDRLDEAHKVVIPGTIEIVHSLHEKGVRLFGLTNATNEAYNSMRRAAPIINAMEDVVVSANVGMVKPEIGIYELLLARNKICPEEALFIDDREDNCQAAEAVGLSAHQFKTSGGLKDALVACNIL